MLTDNKVMRIGVEVAGVVCWADVDGRPRMLSSLVADGLDRCAHLIDDSWKVVYIWERRVLVHSSGARVYKLGKGWLETGERESDC